MKEWIESFGEPYYVQKFPVARFISFPFMQFINNSGDAKYEAAN